MKSGLTVNGPTDDLKACRKRVLRDTTRMPNGCVAFKPRNKYVNTEEETKDGLRVTICH
jgi:hypothetical protein